MSNGLVADLSVIAAQERPEPSAVDESEAAAAAATLEAELAEERRRRFQAEVQLYRLQQSSNAARHSAARQPWVPRRTVFASLQELVEVEAEDRAMVVAQEGLALDAMVLSFIRRRS